MVKLACLKVFTSRKKTEMTLLTQPLTKFAKLQENTVVLHGHEISRYYNESVQMAEIFLQNYNNPKLQIHNTI